MQVIVMTSHPAAKGGIGNWSRILQENIKQYDDIEPSFIYPADLDANEKPAIERSFFERVFRGSWLMFRAERQLIQCIKKNSEKKVIHLTSSGSLSVVRDYLYAKTARVFKTPLVFHIRFGRLPDLIKNKSFEWFFLKRAMKQASVIIPIDQKTLIALQEEFPEKKIQLIPNFFDLKSIKTIESENSLEEKNILFVGWIIKAKGIEELLQAWNSVKRQFPVYKLVLVGPITEEYDKTIHESFDLERVEIVGPLPHDEVLNIIRNSSLFVLPSHTEGFPNVVLEAMALGKPIIATDVGAIPEMLEGCGYLVHVKRQEELRDSIIFALQNDNDRIMKGKKAKEKVMSYYSVPVVMDQYHTIWETCIKEAVESR